MVVWFILYIDYSQSRARLLPSLAIMFGVVNSYFVMFLSMKRSSVCIIMNKLYSLQLKFPDVVVNSKDIMKLLCLHSVYLLKLVFDYDWYTETPVFHLVGIFYIVVFTTVYGLLYCWLIIGEKLMKSIILELDRTSHLTLKRIRNLTAYVLEVEQFIRLISKHFGFFHLILGLQVVGVYIAYLSSKMVFLLLSFKSFDKQSLQVFIHVVEWNILIYMLYSTCYQSHKVNLQVTFTE